MTENRVKGKEGRKPREMLLELANNFSSSGEMEIKETYGRIALFPNSYIEFHSACTCTMFVDRAFKGVILLKMRPDAHVPIYEVYLEGKRSTKMQTCHCAHLRT